LPEPTGNPTSVNISNAIIAPALNAPSITSAAYQPTVNTQRIKKNLDQNSTINSYQFPVDRPKYYMSINISKYSRQSLLRIGALTPIASVTLPLPQEIVDVHTVDYDQTPLGAFAGTVGNAAGDVASQMKNAIAAGQPVIGAFADAIKKVAPDSIAGATAAAGLSALGTAGQIVSAYSGFSPNQFLTVLLKGPQYKRHQFSWKISPRNAQESENMKQIIRLFNNTMAPGLAAGGAFFTFPHIMEIAFMPNSRQLFKFKPAVLENMAINYAGGGIPAFFKADSYRNNAPESFIITMRFLELEFWITGDFTDSNDPLDVHEGMRNIGSPITTEDLLKVAGSLGEGALELAKKLGFSTLQAFAEYLAGKTK
jgi:hypothetical protein